MLERLGRVSCAQRTLLLACGCVLLFGLWWCRVPLHEPDETRYASATQTMLQTGDFLLPQYNGAPRYEKPILYYWIQSTSMRLFGVGEWAARVPSAIFGVLLVLLLHACFLRWLAPRAEDARGRGAAFLGAAACAVMPLITPWAREGVTDVILTFFITAAIAALLQAELTRESRWYYVAAVACGLAFLTKGPIGLAVPGAVWLAYHLRQRTLLSEVRRLPWLPTLGLFLLVAAPWYLATLTRGTDFLQQFFATENGARFAGKEAMPLLQRLGMLFGYLPQALVFFFPASVFVIAEAVTPFGGDAALEEDRLVRVRRFAWAWVLVILGVFSLSKTQYPNYIQSMAGGMALLFALHLYGRLGQPAGGPGWLRGAEGVLLVAIGVVLSVSTALWSLGVLTISTDRDAWALPLPHPAAQIAGVLMLVAGTAWLVSVLVGLLARRPGWLVGGGLLAWAGIVGVLAIGILPLYYIRLYGQPAVVGRGLGAAPGAVIAYVKKKPENLVFYSRRAIIFHETRQPTALPEIQALLRAQGQATIVTSEADLADLATFARIRILRRQGYFVVGEMTPR